MIYVIDQRWLFLDAEFNKLSCKVRNAVDDSNRAAALKEFLALCDEVVSTQNASDEMKVFCEVAYLLQYRLCNDAIWDWLFKVCASANRQRRHMLKEAILELVPAKPVKKEDLGNLWKMWGNPKTRWAVYCAYEHRPRQLIGDRRKIKGTKKANFTSAP